MAPWYAEGTIQDPSLRADAASIFNMESVAKTKMLSEEQVE